MSKEKDLGKLRKMRNGDNVTINCNWKYIGAEVYKVNYCFIVFYVPQYGGEGSFEDCFKGSEPEKVIELAYSWT
tara:strand:+ start:96 stop:317 length:222 start_codon:yes stop_codon:yes gene_type:complete